MWKSMKELETKDSSERFELKAEDEGQVTGLLSTFGNIDLGDDIVEAGAFKRSLNSMRKSGKGLKMLVQHSTNQRAGMFPIKSLKETDEGLITTGGLINMETQLGRDAFSDAKFGTLDSFSIGFIAERVEFVTKSIKGIKRMIRRLLEVRLMESSLVVFAMNPKAAVTGTKSRWEEMETGQTHGDNKIMVSILSDLAALRQGPAAKSVDSDSPLSEIVANLADLNKSIKGV